MKKTCIYCAWHKKPDGNSVESKEEDAHDETAEFRATNEDKYGNWDESAANSRLPNKLSPFDEDDFIAYFMGKRRDCIPCCDLTCYHRLSQQQILFQAKVLCYFKIFSPAYTLNLMSRIYVMPCYIFQFMEIGNITSFSLPTILHKHRRKVWM